MCSIGEEDFGDEGGAHAMIEDIKSIEIIDEICKKCSNEKSVIKLVHSLCKTCFLTHVTHKFRATLGSTKIIPRGSNVLLNFSARAADVCLLDMINAGLMADFNKKLRFNLEIVYIDESCVSEEENKRSDVKQRYENVVKIRTILEQFENFKCHYMSIADKKFIVSLNDMKESDMNSVIASESSFLKVFHSLGSITSKQDFIETIKSENLRHMAAKLKCQFIFLADTTIDLAKRLISNMALGRGSSVSFDVSFCDDRIQSTRIIRPIKDLSTMEVDNYNKFNSLRTLDAQNVKFGNDAGQFASIQNMTSQFIDGLQDNFSSTVSTVYRGCSKIAPKLNRPSAAININQRCSLCKSFLDYQNSKTLYAIEFSRYVSEAAADSEKLLKNTEKIEEKAASGVNSDGNEFKRHLCHGCRNIFLGVDDEEVLAEILNDNN